MPTYEYECGSCGKTIEIFQPISEKPKRKCPECGGLKLRRLPGGGAGLIFKGSGFYITDYRSKDYTERAKAEGEKSPAAAAEKSGAASKTDAPAKKEGGSSTAKADPGAKSVAGG